MNRIKNILADIVLFTIYITMRVVHCLSFWHPFPRYSDWKVCTQPNYKEKHTKEFYNVVLRIVVVLIFTVVFKFWWAVLFGVEVTELSLFVIWLIQKFNKKAPN